MTLGAQMHLGGVPGEVRTARRWLGAWLTARGCRPEFVDTARLLLSELVTNALAHTRGAVNVGVNLDGDRLRVEVTDRDPGRFPEVVTRPGAAESGRGIAILDSLATRWGVDRGASDKSVWFEIELRRSEMASAGSSGLDLRGQAPGRV